MNTASVSPIFHSTKVLAWTSKGYYLEIAAYHNMVSGTFNPTFSELVLAVSGIASQAYWACLRDLDRHFELMALLGPL